MQKTIAFVYAVFHLITDVAFAIASLAAVAVATALAFSFAAEPELVAAVLILGFLTALAETRLRADQADGKDGAAPRTVEQASDRS